MRRGARGSRAPLAPLHNNSLRGELPRATSAGTKAESKFAAAGKSKDKSSAPQRKLPGDTEADSTSSRHHKSSDSKASPVKPRKTSQLVTTSAAPRSETLARIRKAVRKPAGSAPVPPPSTATSAAARVSALAARRQTAAAQPAQASESTAGASAGAAAASASVHPFAQVNQRLTTPDAAQTKATVSSALDHWYLPATPPSVRAILGSLDSPDVAVAPGLDAQYVTVRREASPLSAVLGVGTPQDFSDVFDLDEVNGQTPGGAATFVGYRDTTPGLILDSADETSNHPNLLHSWLSPRPVSSPALHHPQPSHSLVSKQASQKPVTPQGDSLAPQQAMQAAGRPGLATPAAAEILGSLRIKTPPVSTSSATAARVRSSPFLAQLLRTAPAPTLTPTPSTQLHQGCSSSSVPAACSAAFSEAEGASTVTDESLAASSPDPLPARALATASMESAGSNSPIASGEVASDASDAACVTPVLSESAAESAIRQALLRLASTDKVIRLMSPVDLDKSNGNNPHVAFSPADGSLPKFTLAALDSPGASPSALTRQSSGSVNGPEEGASPAGSPVSSQSHVVPIQAVVSQLLSSPKLAITGGESTSDDKTPYQTLLQHLMGSGRAAASSPGSAAPGPRAAADSPGATAPGLGTAANSPGTAANSPVAELQPNRVVAAGLRAEGSSALFRAMPRTVMHPIVHATPARHRLAQTTYKTPSTEATGLDGDSPTALSFCFGSPVTDQPSPLATFLHQLSHATYESHSSADESAAHSSAAETAPETQQADGAEGTQCEAQNGPTPFQDFMKYLAQATYHSPGTKPEWSSSTQSASEQSGGTASTSSEAPSQAAAEKERVAPTPVRLSEEGLTAWLRRSQASHAIRTPARHQLQEVWRQAGQAQDFSQETSKVTLENAALRQRLAGTQESISQLAQSKQAFLQDAQVQREAAIAEGEQARRVGQQLLALAHQTGKVTEAYEAERHALKQDVMRAQTQLIQAQSSSRAAESSAHTSEEEKGALVQALALARENLKAAEEAAQAQSHRLNAAAVENAELLAQLDLTQQQLQQQLTKLTAVKAQSGERAQAQQAAMEKENQQLRQQLKEAAEQLQSATTAEQLVSLQIVVSDDSSDPISATVTPAKSRSDMRDLSCGLFTTPGAETRGRESVCATPEARAAADHLLRGLGMAQMLNFGGSYDLEPEWPRNPPPSLATSPPMAPDSVRAAFALPADLVRTLSMSSELDASLPSELETAISSCSLSGRSVSPELKGPCPTPSAGPLTPGGTPHPSAPTLDVKDIAAAFRLVQQELNELPVSAQNSRESGLVAGSPVVIGSPLLGSEQVLDDISPVVKTTRQVSSVLAAVAELEAAQRVITKGKPSRRFTVGANISFPPSSTATAADNVSDGASNLLLPKQDNTPVCTVRSRFFQLPVEQSLAPTEQERPIMEAPTASNVANPLFTRSNVANPLFSPMASSADPMLTPFYTPASMSSIRTGFDTPASRLIVGAKGVLVGSSAGAKRVLAGNSAVASPAGVSTPGSGVSSGDWRSVTDRLQALRAQLQSAQKKLKASSQEKQKRNALSRTPLADDTPRQAQSGLALPHVMPLPLQSLKKAFSSRADADSAFSSRASPANALNTGAIAASALATGQDSALHTPAFVSQDSMEEQCLSAGRWLRGLAEECVDNMHTPAKPQCTEEDDAEAQIVLLAAMENSGQMAGLQGRAKELMSHPVPSSPSTWDEASVMSSPAVSVQSPVACTASNHMASSSFLA